MKQKLKSKKSNSEQLTLLLQEDTGVLDYKDAYRQIRNYLAGQHIGATRDEALLAEVIKCLFCKLHLRRQQQNNSPEDSFIVAKKYRQAFRELQTLLPALFSSKALFSPQEELLLDPASIAYIDQKLERIDLENWNRDPFGDAYEVFIGSAVRGQEGQFFTPQNAVELLVSLVNPRPGEKIIDPACGAGGFLNAAARHLLATGTSPAEVTNNIFGVDKDSYLVSLASARLSLVTLAKPNVSCADSLAWAAEIDREFPLKDYMGEFDVILTNPPFGSRIISASPQVQESFLPWDTNGVWKGAQANLPN